MLKYYGGAASSSIMGDGTTTIQVSDEMWSELNSRKQPGDTFEDVLWRLVEEAEQSD